MILPRRLDGIFNPYCAVIVIKTFDNFRASSENVGYNTTECKTSIAEEITQEIFLKDQGVGSCNL